MKILEKHVELMAEWSKLLIRQDQKGLLALEFNEILQNLSIIEEIEIENTESFHIDDIPLNAFREDRVESSLERELIIKNAPHSYEGMFLVPKILE